MIFAINGHTFETFDQATTAAINEPREVPYLLRSGLLGDVEGSDFSGELRHLRQSGGAGMIVHLEVPLVIPESGETKIHYLQGTCISLDGLVIVPSLLTSIEEGKMIKVYGKLRGTAKLVSTDELHKLTLLKLDIPGQKFFSWIKCLTAMSSSGQRLSALFEFNAHSPPQLTSVTVAEINQGYSSLPDCHDAFTIDGLGNIPVGARLMSIDYELQGILVEKSQSAPESDKVSPHACLPAVHIEALRAKYRASNAEQ